MPRNEKWVLAACLTVMFRISFGIALHSWAGVCVGICMGAAFGLYGSEEDDADDTAARKASDHGEIEGL